MYLILVNPEAGNNTYKRIERRFMRQLDSLGVKYRIVLIEDLADVPELLEKNLKASDKAVIAVGGNATVNTIINAMVNEDVALGIVPISKTNYLAQTLGLSNWTQATRLLANPVLERFRVGKIDQYYFIGNIHVASRQNVLFEYLDRRSPFKTFLGLNEKKEKKTSAIEAHLNLDEELDALVPMDTLTISLNGVDGSKKLKIEAFTSSNLKKPNSLFHGDAIVIDSKTKLPVIMGNETVAHTPVKIKGMARYINLLAPEDKLTSEVNS